MNTKKFIKTLPFIFCLTGCKSDFVLNWSDLNFNPDPISIDSSISYSNDQGDFDVEGEYSKFGHSYFLYKDTVLPYRIYRPENYENNGKLPLILALHGAGNRGDDNKNTLSQAFTIPFINNDANFLNSIIIVPQCAAAPNAWVDYDVSSGCYSAKEISESNELNAAYNLIKLYSTLPWVDEKRIYVIGLSMGGYGTFDIAARHSDLFAAAVPICGAGPIDDESISNLKNVPIYAFHGTLDDIVKYEISTPIIYNKIVNAGGSKIIYKEFENYDHGIWDIAINYQGDDTHPNLSEWLFSQSK